MISYSCVKGEKQEEGPTELKEILQNYQSTVTYVITIDPNQAMNCTDPHSLTPETRDGQECVQRTPKSAILGVVKLFNSSSIASRQLCQPLLSKWSILLTFIPSDIPVYFAIRVCRLAFILLDQRRLQFVVDIFDKLKVVSLSGLQRDTDATWKTTVPSR